MLPETYILLHRMLGTASTKKELKIVLRRFQEIIKGKKDATSRDDLFDLGWAISCTGDIYRWLNKPLLAEQAYTQSIELFDKITMPGNSAMICFTLAKMLVKLGRNAEAEEQLKDNAIYTARWRGESHHYTVSAREELTHFQQTGQIVEAVNHLWCRHCGVDKYGVGFDEVRPQTTEVDDTWPQ